jgi:predicted TIM-barrel fold metal-dependent hydrolase
LGRECIDADREDLMSKEPVVVVSADTHVAPALSDLRPYCPKKYLEDFDAVAAQPEVNLPAMFSKQFGGDQEKFDRFMKFLLRNAELPGVTDPKARIADMDYDGVAAGVMFFGSPTGVGFRTIPFSIGHTAGPANNRLEQGHSARELELAAAGRMMYNRWLADFCSTAPERHVGLVHIPNWDLDESIKVMQWAKENGLRGVNFYSPEWHMPTYSDPAWNSFFAAAADLELPLTVHVDNGTEVPPFDRTSATQAVRQMEMPFTSGRNLWHMILHGVFDRHPKLTSVITEVIGTWWTLTLKEMDRLYNSPLRGGDMLRLNLKKPPMEYFKNNCYLGLTMMSREEAEAAVQLGVTERVMWGTDYPHPEGSFHSAAPGEPIVSRLALANTYAGLDEAQIRDMVGLNAIRCYGLDAAALTKVGRRVGPDIKEITSPPDLSKLPDGYASLAFREADLEMNRIASG